MTITFTGGIIASGEIKANPNVPPPYIANAVNFDGTNDFLDIDTGGGFAAESKQVTLSVWFKKDADGSLINIMDTSNGRMDIRVTSANKVSFVFQTNGSAPIWSGSSTNSFTTSSGWTHLLMSLDTGTGVRSLYLNDVLETIVSESFFADRLIAWIQLQWGIGGRPNGDTKWNGDLSEYYLTNESIDLSDVDNRRKFIDASGKPVDLGADGSTPTGTQSLVYFRGNTAAWNAGTNSGSVGDYTMNGAVTDAASSPSD